jgi:hypothetical protein
MATVHLAEDLKHKRKVAFKVLKPELTAASGAEREGRIAASGVDHHAFRTTIRIPAGDVPARSGCPVLP